MLVLDKGDVLVKNTALAQVKTKPKKSRKMGRKVRLTRKKARTRGTSMEVQGSSGVESPQYVLEEGSAMPMWIVTNLEDAMGCMHALQHFLLRQEVQK